MKLQTVGYVASLILPITVSLQTGCFADVPPYGARRPQDKTLEEQQKESAPETTKKSTDTGKSKPSDNKLKKNTKNK